LAVSVASLAHIHRWIESIEGRVSMPGTKYIESC
jgi:hypothetical protein